MPNGSAEISQSDLTDKTNRVEAYARVALTADATAKAVKGEGLKVDDFKKVASQEQVQSVKASANPLFDIFNSLKPDQLEFTSNQATQVVEVGGKVFQVTLARESEQSNNYQVSLSQYAIDANNQLTTNPITKAPIGVSVARDAQGQVTTVTAEEQGIKVVSGQFLDRPHQVDAVLATVGKTRDAAGSIVDLPQKPTLQKAQLITAGTGSGKSGILASAALASNGGVFAVPSSLVSDMVDDAKKFTSVPPKTLKDKPAEQSVGDFLQANPCVVLSHDELLANAAEIKGRNVFVDEAHELTANKDKADKLKGLTSPNENNTILAVTATPNQELYDIMGKQIYDVSVFQAQNELKTVRPVVTSDVEALKADIADQALTQLLGRDSKVTDSMKGYNKDNPEANSKLSSEVRGMTFADDKATAQAIFDKLQVIQTDKALQQALNKAAGRGEGTDIAKELNSAHNKAISDSLKIDILCTIAVVTSTKKLDKEGEEKLRADTEKKLRAELRKDKNFDLDKKFTEAVRGLNDQHKGEVTKSLEEQKAKPGLEEYQKQTQQYFSTSLKDGPAKAAGELKQFTEKQPVAVLLTKDGSSKDDIEKAKAQIGKGLVMHIVSDGPLGTGFSNKDILNTVSVQTKDMGGGDAARRMQELGRPIRDDDGFAFVATVTDKDIPNDKRTPTAAQVFAKDAIDHYNNAMEKERSLELQKKVQELTKENQELKLEKEALQKQLDESQKAQKAMAKEAENQRDSIMAAQVDLVKDLGTILKDYSDKKPGDKLPGIIGETRAKHFNKEFEGLKTILNDYKNTKNDIKLGEFNEKADKLKDWCAQEQTKNAEKTGVSGLFQKIKDCITRYDRKTAQIEFTAMSAELKTIQDTMRNHQTTLASASAKVAVNNANRGSGQSL